MELRSILELLWKMRRVVIMTFAAVFVVVVVGSLLITPWYKVGARVLLENPRAASTLLESLDLDYDSSKASISDTDKANQIALASMQSVASKVVSELKLTRKRIRYQLLDLLPFSGAILKAVGIDERVTHKPVSPREFVGGSTLARIFPRPYVEISQFQDTDILEVTAVSTDIDEAVRIANSTAEAMVQAEIGRTKRDFAFVGAFISENLEKARQDYLAVLKATEEFIDTHKALDLESETEAVVDRMAALKQSIENTESMIAETETKMGMVKSRLSSVPMYRKSSATEASLAQTQKEALQELYLDLAEVRAKYTAEHPAVIAIRNKIDSLKEMLEEAEQRVDGTDTLTIHPVYQVFEEELTDYEINLTGLKKKREILPKTLAKYESYIPEIVRKQNALDELVYEATAAKSIYDSLLKLRYQAKAVQSLAVAGISIVERAVVPGPGERSKQKHPDFFLSVITAVLLGAFFSLGSGLLAAYVDDTIRTKEDLKLFAELTVLGVIPMTGRNGLQDIRSAPAGSATAEAIRMVRDSICFALEGSDSKSLVITSAVPGEGKTFLAAGAAVSAAKSGKKVLLMDCNMIHPAVHSCFDLPNEQGLTEFLGGIASEEDVQKSTEVEGLTIVPAGTARDDAGALLESERMRRLIETMGNKYDLVVLDAPAFQASYDGVILGKWSEGAVFVVAESSTPRSLLSSMLDAFGRVGVNVAGAVLNKTVQLPSLTMKKLS